MLFKQWNSFIIPCMSYMRTTKWKETKKCEMSKKKLELNTKKVSLFVLLTDHWHNIRFRLSTYLLSFFCFAKKKSYHLIHRPSHMSFSASCVCIHLYAFQVWWITFIIAITQNILSFIFSSSNCSIWSYIQE